MVKITFGFLLISRSNIFDSAFEFGVSKKQPRIFEFPAKFDEILRPGPSFTDCDRLLKN